MPGCCWCARCILRDTGRGGAVWSQFLCTNHHLCCTVSWGGPAHYEVWVSVGCHCMLPICQRSWWHHPLWRQCVLLVLVKQSIRVFSVCHCENVPHFIMNCSFVSWGGSEYLWRQRGGGAVWPSLCHDHGTMQQWCFCCTIYRQAKQKLDGSEYHILLILTDGDVDDMPNTKRTIVEVWQPPTARTVATRGKKASFCLITSC